VNEPTMVARPKRKKWSGLTAPRGKTWLPIAFGRKAKEMLSKEPKTIEVISPMKNGIISDLEAVESLASHFLKNIYDIPAKYPKLFKPQVVVGVPSSITNVQKRAVGHMFESIGVGKVTIVEESILAAIGLGLSMEEANGTFILDIGSGKTEASVISMGGVVVGRGIKTAGNEFDDSIINYIKMKYGILIGPVTAERIKIELLGGKERSDFGIIRGRDLETGLPKSVKVRSGEIGEAINLQLTKIAKLVAEVLDETPPELMEDILKKGIIMIGGGAKIWGFGKIIEDETNINVEIADNPKECVIRGCGRLVEDPSMLNEIKLVIGG